MYASRLLAKYPTALTNVAPAGVVALYVDFNGVIHESAVAVLSRRSASPDLDALHAEIFSEIDRRIHAVVREVRPTRLVFLAVDGVAPPAKQKQQRLRRHLAAMRRDKIARFREANGMPDAAAAMWDSNCISPGTEFMKLLDAHVSGALCESLLRDAAIDVVYTGHADPGEGEQKIFDDVHARAPAVAVVHGLDADLIMLGMLSPAGTVVYLMRCRDDDDGGSGQPAFLDTSEIGRGIGVDRRDYVLTCCFLGNDFLPNLPFLRLADGGLDVVADVYRRTNRRLVRSNPVTGKFEIDRGALSAFLDDLANMEDATLDHALARYHHQRRPLPPRPHVRTALERFVDDLDRNVDRGGRFLFPLADPSGWRRTFYSKMFGDATEGTVRSACQNYLEGLDWMTEYYMNRGAGTRRPWAYRYMYDYAPSVYDIAGACRDVDVGASSRASVDASSRAPVDAEVALLAVLPASSARRLLSSPAAVDVTADLSLGCVQYYPLRFEMHTFMADFLHQCVPRLPLVDTDRIVAALEVSRRRCDTPAPLNSVRP